MSCVHTPTKITPKLLELVRPPLWTMSAYNQLFLLGCFPYFLVPFSRFSGTRTLFLNPDPNLEMSKSLSSPLYTSLSASFFVKISPTTGLSSASTSSCPPPPLPPPPPPPPLPPPLTHSDRQLLCCPRFSTFTV